MAYFLYLSKKERSGVKRVFLYFNTTSDVLFRNESPELR